MNHRSDSANLTDCSCLECCKTHMPGSASAPQNARAQLFETSSSDEPCCSSSPSAPSSCSVCRGRSTCTNLRREIRLIGKKNSALLLSKCLPYHDVPPSLSPKPQTLNPFRLLHARFLAFTLRGPGLSSKWSMQLCRKNAANSRRMAPLLGPGRVDLKRVDVSMLP